MDENTSLAFLDADILKPITEALSDNLEILLPVGIGILGILIGVSLIPRIVYKFL